MSNLDVFIKVTIALLVIIVFAQVFGRLIKLIGQPAVVGEMISGVVLGPTVLGYFFPETSASVFSKDIMPYLFVLSNLGLSVYMFLVGAEIDLKLFNKRAVKDASALSIAALVFPFLLGGIAAFWFNDEINSKHIDATALILFLGTAFAITAFPMLARILQEKNIVNTRIGVLSLLSASMQDVVSWILLALVTVMASTHNYMSVATMVIGAAIYILLLFYIIKPLLSKTAKKIQTDKDLSQGAFAVVIFLLLLSALITDKLGLYSVFGGFIFGLSLPREGVYVQAISSKIKDITVVLLLPVFFAFSGLNANLLVLGELNLWGAACVIILFAFVSKYFSCMFTMRWVSKFSWGESSAIGGLINARGLMELIIANIGLFYGLIDTGLYSILVLVAITTTLAAMPIYNLSLGLKNSDL